MRCLPLAELQGLYRAAGLGEPGARFSELRDTVANLLARSFPNPGDDTKIVELFARSIDDDRLGIPVHCPKEATTAEAIEYAYPVAILSAKKS